jgi:hypothetical protein
MSSPRESLITTLRQIVAEHYDKDSSPLLLSALGSTLKRRQLWEGVEQTGKSLRQVIEEANDPDLLILRDKNSPSFIAVATANAKSVVEQRIDLRSQSVSVVPNLEALPRSVLFAFCVRQEEGKPIFLHKSPPFRYETGGVDEDDSEHFLKIDERYRRPGLDIQSVENLTATDRLDLQTKIAAWARDNGVLIESFYKAAGKKHTNALERFLAAQPKGVAEKIMLPADIALLLSQHD